MTRAEQIERAVKDAITKWDLTGFIDTSTKDYSLMIAIKEALALPPDDVEAVACKYFWSGASGHFYTNTLEQGEMIVKHLPDGDDYTATELTQPKADPRKAELVRRIDEVFRVLGCGENEDLLKDLRDYLEST